MNRKAADILRKAKALIDRPERWFGPPGHDGHGNCAMTAINEALGIEFSGIPSKPEKMLAMLVCGSPCGLARWNNTPGRTHADVMAAFDCAIALADPPQRPSDEEYTKRFIASLSTQSQTEKV